MKVRIVQPSYPINSAPEDARKCMDWMLDQLTKLGAGSTDLVVLPEYANAPGLDGREDLSRCAVDRGFTDAIADQAKRLGALISVGTVAVSGSELVNRTLLFNKNGEAIAEYDKTHLTEVEVQDLRMRAGNGPMVIETESLRIGFAVCFEFYFAEFFATLAMLKPDIIICPSYQRSEAADRIRSLSSCRALDGGAWLLRSSFALPDSGGHSLVAAPDGAIVCDAAAEIGLLEIDIEPKKRYVKPASHGQQDVEHRTLIERNRKPSIYGRRAVESATVAALPYPRLCAHRGWSTACPENTLPAFAAAIAAGAQEIELDLRLTADHVVAIVHDPDVDRTTNGSGKIADLRWKDLQRLDAGSWKGKEWANVSVPRLEEVLTLVAGKINLNLHVYDADPDGILIGRMYDLLKSEGIVNAAYVAGDIRVLEQALYSAPDLTRACLEAQADPSSQIEIAIRMKCGRIQFGRNVSPSEIALASSNNLICNLFYSDDPAEAKNYLKAGIDVILTNNVGELLTLWR